tara:strand:- start:302 stop:550 length:249 start_codon:yes stop_codon:yes gene_type:complete
MGLKIFEKNGTFQVIGNVNHENVGLFQSHLENNLAKLKSVTLDVNQISSIDKTGIKALRTLYKKAFLVGKSFSIIGYGCKDI